MGAAGGAAGAVVIEHHPPPEQRGGDPYIVGECLVLDDTGDRVAFELHVHPAGQAQAAAASENARVEDASEVPGGEGCRHWGDRTRAIVGRETMNGRAE